MTDVNTPLSLAVDRLADLLEDWRVHLRARNVAPSTISLYLGAAGRLCRWLAAQGMPDTAHGVSRDHLEAYLAHLADQHAPTTVSKEFRSLQQLFKWLVNDGEIERSPMERMPRPMVPEQPVPLVDLDTVRRLLAALAGNTFERRRDTAMVRLFLDTGVRLGEMVGMTLEDVDQDGGAVFVMGKGRRGRAVPYGAKTADALRRYLRARRQHPPAGLTAALWLGKKGPMTDSGVRQMLERRCEQAGVPRINPHAFRHLAAHRWLAAGGQETDLMRLHGWKSRQMVARYAASAADQRTREAHRRLALGDDI
jgi:site-specific recombinase XerD